MNAETYKTLTPKEQLMYDELHAFAKRLTDEMAAVRTILERIIKEADA